MLSRSLPMDPHTPERFTTYTSRYESPPPTTRNLFSRDSSSVYNNRSIVRRLDYVEDINILTMKPIIFKSCEPNSECSICLKNDVGILNGGALSCNHTFHNDCIKQWFNMSSCCPNCRQVVH
jgi:hypothetical protein